jgi:hypothetical protein
MMPPTSPESLWSSPQTLTTPEEAAAAPAIGVSRSGIVHLLYTRGSDIYHRLRAADEWSDPIRVASGESPSFVVVGETVHAVYAKPLGGNHEVYYVKWQEGRWSLPRNLSFTSGPSTLPQIASAPDGTLHAVWADTTPGYSVIYHAHQVGTYWVNRPIPSGRGSAPSLAVDETGTAHVAWQDRDGGASTFEVYYARGDGRNWSLPQNLSASPEGNSLAPQVAVAWHNEVYVAWQEDDQGRSQIYATHSTPAGWTVPAGLTPAGQSARQHRLAFTSQGVMHLAWLQGNQVCHRYIAPGGILKPVETLAEEPQGVSDPALALTPGTWDVHVLWLNTPSAGRVLRYAQRLPALRFRYFIPYVVVNQSVTAQAPSAAATPKPATG